MCLVAIQRQIMYRRHRIRYPLSRTFQRTKANWKYVLIEVFQFWVTPDQDQSTAVFVIPSHHFFGGGCCSIYLCQRSLQIGCLLLPAQFRRSPPDVWRQQLVLLTPVCICIVLLTSLAPCICVDRNRRAVAVEFSGCWNCWSHMSWHWYIRYKGYPYICHVCRRPKI
jgi:hypothetical protein